jgi:hypothetical protein
MNRVVKLNEQDLIKIVKRIILEQTTTKDDLKIYRIDPSVTGGATTLYVAVKDGKIYFYDRFSGKVKQQIGGWANQEEAYAAQSRGDAIYEAGFNYVYKSNSNNSTLNYFANRMAGFSGYAFIFNEKGEPTLIGLVSTKRKKNEVSLVMSKPGNEVKLEPTTSKTPTSTFTTKTNVPQNLTLDLQDAFFYDCPNMPGCNSQGGSNQRPLIDNNAYKKIEDFGSILNEYYKDNTPIYVLGFASAEGNAQHNLRLSQNRANFVASLIRTKITNPNIRIIPVGRGATSAFDSTNLPPNRRIVVTLDQNSTTPHVFKFSK